MSAKLFKAIQEGDKAKVASLLHKDPNLVLAKDKNKLSPVMVALYNQKPDIAALFFERLVALYGNAIDRDRVLAIVRELAEALGEPERVAAVQRLFSATLPPENTQRGSVPRQRRRSSALCERCKRSAYNGLH